MELLFRFLSFSPGPFWLLLIFAPRHRVAMRAFDAYLVLLCTIFALQSLPAVPELLPLLASPELGAIRELLGSEKGAVASWNAMILADLWIGRWIVHDALALGAPAWLRIPIVVVVLFFGFSGLFLYLVYRLAVARRFALVDVEAATARA